jgi:hypothetical protein
VPVWPTITASDGFRIIRAGTAGMISIYDLDTCLYNHALITWQDHALSACYLRLKWRAALSLTKMPRILHRCNCQIWGKDALHLRPLHAAQTLQGTRPLRFWHQCASCLRLKLRACRYRRYQRLMHQINLRFALFTDNIFTSANERTSHRFDPLCNITKPR